MSIALFQSCYIQQFTLLLAHFPSCSTQQFILFLAHADFGPRANVLKEEKVQIAVNESI